MTDSTEPTKAGDAVPRPSFTLGITGNMDLILQDGSGDNGPSEELRHRLETIFLFLKFGGQCADPRGGEYSGKCLAESFADLLAIPDLPTGGDGGAKCAPLSEEWEGLGQETEMVLLTSLAPGADTIAADVISDLAERFGDDGFRARVRAVLPFSREVYRESSTFIDRDDPAAAKASFDAWMDKLEENPEDVVPVYTAMDLVAERRLSREGLREMEAVYEDDVTKTRNRRTRYKAAGEYVTTFSDLLIAVFDGRLDRGEMAGSLETVESKRRGATPGLLPFTEGFTWADNGPIFHLFHPRGKVLKRESEGEEIPDPPGKPLRILHPYELGPKNPDWQQKLAYLWSEDELEKLAGQVEAQEAEEFRNAYWDWQEKGNSLWMRIARNLRDFNGLEAIEGDGEALRLCETKRSSSEMEETPEQREERILDGLSEEGRRLVRGLEPIAKIRRRAATYNASYKQRVDRTMMMLFWMAFAAAYLLHCFSHWYPAVDYVSKKGASHAGATFDQTPGLEIAYQVEEEGHPSPSPEPGHSAHAWKVKLVKVAKPILGCMGLAMGGHSLLVFLLLVASRCEEKEQDYRALSEGLRVQFFWGLCGLRRSVSTNYMQRFRSELNWLRNAIASVSFPTERFQQRFLALCRSDQIRLFEIASANWVEGQKNYFVKASKKKGHQLHCFHLLGSHIALAGLILAVVLVYLVYQEKASHYQFEIALWYDSLRVRLCIIVIPLIFLLTAVLHRFGPGHGGDESEHGGCVEWLATMFLQNEDTARQANHFRKSIVVGLRNFLQMLPQATLIAVFLLAVSFEASKRIKYLPDPYNMAIILFGACLVGGALIVAYSEKQLLSENERQYRSMAKLYACASERFRRNIDRLKFCDSVLSADDPVEMWKAVQARQIGKKTDEIPDPFLWELDQIQNDAAKIRAELVAAYNLTLEQTHDLLFALGKEALDENTEWLILHRARPMEPVMAG